MSLQPQVGGALPCRSPRPRAVHLSWAEFVRPARAVLCAERSDPALTRGCRGGGRPGGLHRTACLWAGRPDLLREQDGEGWSPPAGDQHFKPPRVPELPERETHSPVSWGVVSLCLMPPRPAWRDCPEKAQQPRTGLFEKNVKCEDPRRVRVRRGSALLCQPPLECRPQGNAGRCPPQATGQPSCWREGAVKGRLSWGGRFGTGARLPQVSPGGEGGAGGGCLPSGWLSPTPAQGQLSPALRQGHQRAAVLILGLNSTFHHLFLLWRFVL